MKRQFVPWQGSTRSAKDTNEYDLKLDRLNKLWIAVERKLLVMQPPRYLWVVYDTKSLDEHGLSQRNFCLGIVRRAGTWHICHGTFDQPGAIDEPKEWKPITECSVEIRVRAVDHIEQLKREVENTGKTVIPELNAAISTLEGLIQDDQ